jgi:hypothetical protein
MKRVLGRWFTPMRSQELISGAAAASRLVRRTAPVAKALSTLLAVMMYGTLRRVIPHSGAAVSRLGFGRIVASEIEVSNMLVILL